jgi:diaminohydroxyphosphoribosylaminopyrimidine deaminase/5-amino-6-(5-phosphoribosylamino)uracil reductase
MSESPEIDRQFMRRAIRLAMNGRGRVEPNPMVGCVIVSADGRVIGEGFHRVFGGAHAEPEALGSCVESPRGATAYVTLEPCCHTNKKTPPCAPRVIEAGIARVVVGCLDPNPEVDGKGVGMLREAGIRVDAGVLEGEAKQLIAPFIARTRLGRPYVTLKWAQTADGKVAGAGGERMQISNAISRELVHDLRSRSDGILVGANTVLTDDPALNARFARIRRDPARFVLDRDLRTPVEAQVIRDRSVSTTLFCGYDMSGPFRRRRDALEAAGATVTMVNTEPAGRLKLEDVLRRVSGGFSSDLLVEPGPTLAAGFFAEPERVDRLWVFRSSKVAGDPTAPAAAEIPAYFVESGRVELDGDTLTEYLNPRSPVYFANAPSADLVLARS